LGGLSTAGGRDSGDSRVAGDSGDGGDGPESVLLFDLGTGGGKEAKSDCAYSRIDSSVLAEGIEGEAEWSIYKFNKEGRRSKRTNQKVSVGYSIYSSSPLRVPQLPSPPYQAYQHLASY
jgi:hypothetical protein